MLRRNRPPVTDEIAARLGARDNLLLGVAQLTTGILTGNVGFFAEAGHQVADSASLKAKADAMRVNCSPRKAKMLRRVGAGVLVAGGALGIGGALQHIHGGTIEDHGSLEVGAALSGAVINAVVAKRAHGADHSNHDHGHSHGTGAAVDAKIHMLTDMGTGAAYAGALLLEPYVPGISNPVLLLNGAAIGGAGVATLRRISRDDSDHHEH